MSMIFGILVTLSGFSNMIIQIIIKRPMKTYALWKYLLYAKVVLTILVTPLTNLMIFGMFISESST